MTSTHKRHLQVLPGYFLDGITQGFNLRAVAFISRCHAQSRQVPQGANRCMNLDAALLFAPVVTERETGVPRDRRADRVRRDQNPNVSMTQICRTLGMSRATFYRLLKAKNGQNLQLCA